MKQAGRERYSIEIMYNVLRWEQDLQTNGHYKLNNNYKKYYALLLMQEVPMLDGFFETRDRAIPVAPENYSNMFTEAEESNQYCADEPEEDDMISFCDI